MAKKQRGRPPGRVFGGTIGFAIDETTRKALAEKARAKRTTLSALARELLASALRET